MIELNAQNYSEAVKVINALRRQNKGKWVFACVNVNGLNYLFKFYDTWLQQGYIQGGRIKYSSFCGCSVKEFTETIGKVFDA